MARIILGAFFLTRLLTTSFDQHTVSETVTDVDGLPLPSVNIEIIETSDGAITEIF